MMTKPISRTAAVKSAVVQLLLLTFSVVGSAQSTPGNVILKAEATNSATITPAKMDGSTVSQSLFFTTTMIEAFNDHGNNAVGTGFFWRHQLGTNSVCDFIVTCRHVVAGFTNAVFSFVASKDGKPSLGNKCQHTCINFDRLTFFHPNSNIDITLIPLKPIVDSLRDAGVIPYYVAFAEDAIPTQEQVKELSAIQPIVFVGYPSGIRDESNFIPVCRRGIAATPYVLNFSGLPLFLIDASVFPGSSGSPVLAYDEVLAPRDGMLVARSRSYLLGIVSSAYFRQEDGEVRFVRTPSQFRPVVNQKQYLNIGTVIKVSAVKDSVAAFFKAHPAMPWAGSAPN